MEFKEFKEKCFGKTVEEIKEILKQEKDFFKTDIELVKLCVEAEACAKEISNIDKTFTALYLFKKGYNIMLYIYKELTNLQLIPEDESFSDYDIFVEKAIVESNSNAYFFKETVEEIIKELKYETINKLYETFDKGLPSLEDISKMKDSLKNMFSEESPEKLKTIEDILAFNDPSLKQIKDIVYNSELQYINSDEGNKENIMNDKKEHNENESETDKAFQVLESTNEASKQIVNKIQDNPIVKEIDNKIKKEQVDRVEQYKKQLEEELQKNN